MPALGWLEGGSSSRAVRCHLLVESPEGIQPVEIKATATPTADALRGLDQWRTMTGQPEPRPCLIYGGDTPQRRTETDIIPWRLL